jgi:hypothetical protein
MRSLPDDVRQIIEMAIRAPSGENAQPWQFSVILSNPIVIDVRVSSDRDHSLYGWGDRASYVAIGAAIENISIAASNRGYETIIELLPDEHDPLHAARVKLIKNTEAIEDPLEPYIARRTTNRKKYSKKTVSTQDINTLKKVAEVIGYGEVLFTADTKDAKTLGEVGAYNERIMLNNPILHKFFFSHINWTKSEDDAKKIGFFVDTLELPAPAKIGFSIMRSWNRARMLNQFFHLNKLVSVQNAKVYSSSGVFGIIVSPTESASDALQAGRVVERVWLEATRLGLSIQPVVGLLYFALRVHSGNAEGFSEINIALIEKGYEDVKKIFGLGDAGSYFMFRIGYSDAPSARSTRFSVDEVTTIQS